MSRILKFFALFIILGIVLIGAYFLYESFKGKPSKSDLEDYEWTLVDEYYVPRDLVEDFIQQDASAKDILPVSIRNYGNDKSIMKRFRGSRFAGPTEAQLKMMFKGLEDWKLVDIKYKNDKEREIQRTVLYVYYNGEWSVGDSGKLVQ
ncbi:MAG: hypothetical protein JXB23_08230 [Candidatus Aminicenantes bacterium]|nr:hypothetical protein [Candidatus Aminicenantes bacterium]